jgi:hypothetical protein
VLSRHRFSVLVGLAAAAVFAVIAMYTVSDVDEGYFAVAGELVGRGRMPYRDFFYPQAPFFPYVLGLVWRVAHPTLRGDRIVMAILGGLTAGTIANEVWVETRSRMAAVFGAAFFVCHELSWQWIPMVKSYAMATLFALIAVVLVSREKKPSTRACVVAGILALSATATRLLMAPVLPVVLLGAALRETKHAFWRGLAIGVTVTLTVVRPHVGPVQLALLAAFSVAVVYVRSPIRATTLRPLAVAGGIAIALVPVWLVYRAAPAAFLFGNLGYHAHREAGGLISAWTESRNVLLAMLGVHKLMTYSVAGPQFVLLLILSALSLTQKNRALRLIPALAGVLLTIVSLKPNPAHEQYFVVAVPFFALAAAMAVGHAFSSHRGTLVESRAPYALVAAAYVLLAVPSFDRKWRLAIYDPHNMSATRPSLIERGAALVVRAEDEHPGPLLPTWPGSAIGVADRIMPGFEDHFGRKVAGAMSDEERARFHLARAEDFKTMVTARTPTVVVLDREVEAAGGDALRKRIAECGYVPFGEKVGQTEVFVRTEASSAACR